MPSKKLRAGGIIPKPSLPVHSNPLRFSFKHLHADHKKFRLDRCPNDFWFHLLSRMQYYCSHSAEEFLDQNNTEHRHIIDFANTTEPEGFVHAPGMDDEQLSSIEPWQFEVRSKSDWRVHGFLIDDTFYVVWLDPFHELSPQKKQVMLS